jgi:hypothetical protein
MHLSARLSPISLHGCHLIEISKPDTIILGPRMLPQVSQYFNADGALWGFTVSFLKDGVSATDVRVAFDEEMVLNHEWVGRGADGFPLLEGNSREVAGKNFEIRWGGRWGL